MSGPPALVTGATGWLGSSLVRAIVAGIAGDRKFPSGDPDRLVRCLVHDRRASNTLADIHGRLELCPGDLTDPASLEKFYAGMDGATVFHAAGVVHPRFGVKQFDAVNAVGTKNLIGAAVAAGVKRFIHVSSTSPFGFNPDPARPFDETSAYHPYMNYGKSKKLAEEIVIEAGQNSSLETVIVRPPWFYGPGQPRHQTLFFTIIKKGLVPLPGSGTNLRSMVYLDNLCQGLLRCEQEPSARGQTYWVADRRPYSLNEIIDTIERVMERDFQLRVAHRRVRLPGLVCKLAEAADFALQGAGRYHQKIHVLSEMNRNIFCAIAKAEAELGYDPQIELAEGIRRSIQNILESGGEI